MAKRTEYETGQTIGGRYQLEGVLGAGGFGTVFRARQAPLDRAVAVKICHASSADVMAYERFEREARIIGALRSPHTVRLYDFGLTSEGHPFIAMELIVGHTLAHEFQFGPMRARRLAHIVAEICESLAEAHAKGVVHLDLKPSNVMLERISGRGEMARVLDFGIASVVADSAPEEDRGYTFLGTPRYMAPEQFSSGTASPQTDLFSVGLMIDEGLRGTPTFADTSMPAYLGRHFEDRPPVPRGTPPVLRALLDALLQFDPGQRPSSATAVREELKAWLRSAEAGAENARPVPTFNDTKTVATASTEEFDSRNLGRTLQLKQRGGQDDTRIEDKVPVNLPYHSARFIGREAELTALGDAFARRGQRLVTLLGTGGAGKSRLSVRFGHEHQRSYPGGVWFCDLVEATTLQGVALAVAESFGMPIGGADPVSVIGNMLATRGPSLVILDNFEQVVDHADASVGYWMTAAPDVRFLATSRSPLRLAGEYLVRVPPVDLADALKLFAERAGRANPSFRLTDDNQARVEAIVEKLDRLPLAIELAAARMSMLSLDQLESRLDARFRLLRSQHATHSRQVDMRAAIDWSWALLASIERLALAQCSVFHGGFTLVDAEAVLDLSGAGEDLWPDEVLGALVDKSLIRRWAPARGVLRFGLYESIRAFAREKLEVAGADTSATAVLAEPDVREHLRRRHAQRYGELGQPEALARLRVHGGLEVYATLRVELENLLAAFEAAMEYGETAIGVRCGCALATVFKLQGPVAYGQRLVERVLALPDLDREQRCFVLHEAAMLGAGLAGSEVVLRYWEEILENEEVARRVGVYPVVMARLALHDRDHGRTERARARFVEALKAARESGDRGREGFVLGCMGGFYQSMSEMPRAGACYELALNLTREVGDPITEAVILLNQGTYYDDLGQPDDAEAAYLKVLAPARLANDVDRVGGALANLSLLYRVQGRFGESMRYARDAIALFEGQGKTKGVAISVGNLGDLHYEMGDLQQARRHLEKVLPALDAKVPFAAGAFRGTLALICADEGDFDGAYALLSAGEEQLRNTHAPEFGKIRSRRGLVDLLGGEVSSAQRILAEVTQILNDAGASAHSELAQAVRQLRERLKNAGA